MSYHAVEQLLQRTSRSTSELLQLEAATEYLAISDSHLRAEEDGCVYTAHRVHSVGGKTSRGPMKYEMYGVFIVANASLLYK